MTHDEFVGQVQARARLASSGEAEAAIRATLETLAERLEAGSAEHLAAQLPQEIARHLRGDRAEAFIRMSVDEFLRRVNSREPESVDLSDAVYHVRVVLEVLSEAVSPGALEKLLRVLPEDYARLFGGSRGGLKSDRGQAAGRV